MSPNAGHSWGGGGQDGKWSHSSSIFLTLPLVTFKRNQKNKKKQKKNVLKFIKKSKSLKKI